MNNCKCSMAISVNGDGCRYCQPQEYIDRLAEWLEESRADYAALEAKCAKLRPLAEDRDQQYDMKVKARAQRDAALAECERLRAKLENAYKQVNSECQDWAREYEARRKAVEEREMLAGLLREIAVGISKREMPTEQQLNAWFDRIDAALSAKT